MIIQLPSGVSVILADTRLEWTEVADNAIIYKFRDSDFTSVIRLKHTPDQPPRASNPYTQPTPRSSSPHKSKPRKKRHRINKEKNASERLSKPQTPSSPQPAPPIHRSECHLDDAPPKKIFQNTPSNYTSISHLTIPQSHSPISPRQHMTLSSEKEKAFTDDSACSKPSESTFKKTISEKVNCNWFGLKQGFLQPKYQKNSKDTKEISIKPVLHENSNYLHELE